MLKHKHLDLLYFAIVLLAAYFIKRWYSQAELHDMQWVMQPLAMILELFIPGSFEVDTQGQWYNTSWNIILVKACSGLNFFIASFVVLAIAFQAKISNLTMSKILPCAVLALTLAWPVTLFANTMRILTAMYCIHHPDLLQWTQLNAEQIHRLVGLMIYFPLLILQLQMVKACSLFHSYIVCTTILVLLMIVVPLLTGNAFHRIDIFLGHCIAVFSVILLVGFVLYVMSKIRMKKLSINDFYLN